MSNYMPAVPGYIQSTSGQAPFTKISHEYRDHDAFHAYVESLSERLENAAEQGPIFHSRVAPDTLWVAYLESFPNAPTQQYHNCAACKRFIENYGDLVTVTDTGLLKPVFWGDTEVPKGYESAVQAMRATTQAGTKLEPFVTSEEALGTKERSLYGHHLHARVPVSLRWTRKDQTAYQRAATIKENYRMVGETLEKWGTDLLVKCEALLRADQAIPAANVNPVSWIRDLKEKRVEGSLSRRAFSQYLWREVAKAPDGFCHVGSSAVGEYIDSIRVGGTPERAMAALKANLDPLKYKRPTSLPTEQTVAQAEKLFQAMNLERSLARRLARIDEVQDKIWEQPKPYIPGPSSANPAPSGIFSNVRTKQDVPPPAPQLTRLPATTMTWQKFQAKVLKDAVEMSLFLNSSHAPYMTQFVTAVYPDAEPILKWDHKESRNPINAYCYPKNVALSNWTGIGHPLTRKVLAVTYLERFGDERVDLLLEGVYDRNYRRAGLALFPDTLKTELHPVRKVIEEFSRSHQFPILSRDMKETEVAGGISIKGLTNFVLEVKTKTTIQNVTIDRFD